MTYINHAYYSIEQNLNKATIQTSFLGLNNTKSGTSVLGLNLTTYSAY